MPVWQEGLKIQSFNFFVRDFFKFQGACIKYLYFLFILKGILYAELWLQAIMWQKTKGDLKKWSSNINYIHQSNELL